MDYSQSFPWKSRYLEIHSQSILFTQKAVFSKTLEFQEGITFDYIVLRQSISHIFFYKILVADI